MKILTILLILTTVFTVTATIGVTREYYYGTAMWEVKEGVEVPVLTGRIYVGPSNDQEGCLDAISGSAEIINGEFYVPATLVNGPNTFKAVMPLGNYWGETFIKPFGWTTKTPNIKRAGEGEAVEIKIPCGQKTNDFNCPGILNPNSRFEKTQGP